AERPLDLSTLSLHDALPICGLYPKPPDLRLPETQNLTDGELFWIIENGVRFTGMPAFSNSGGHGGMLDSWKLVHFIRHLPHLTRSEEHTSELQSRVDIVCRL